MVGHDVLIVGAGPVGLTAAIELIRRAAARLVDREGSRTKLSKAAGSTSGALSGWSRAATPSA